MPLGIALIDWTNKTGFFTIMQYPQTLITEEEVMRIGSIHRMRYLEPSFITLNIKNYKVASFYSGMKTARWVIEPNYVISLILESSENAEAYSEILPIASLRILESIRTNTFKNVVPAVFEDIKLGRIIINKNELEKIFPSKAEEKVDLTELKTLRQKVQEQEGIINMLQNMMENKGGASGQNVENLAEIDMLKTRLKMKNDKIEELEKRVSDAEMKASRISLLETRVRTMTADINEKKEIIRELKNKVSSVKDMSGIGGSEKSDDDEIARLSRIIQEKDTIINKLRAKIESGETDGSVISSITKDLEDSEGLSKYIGL
ncbi:MAG: hypothetical protein EU551_01970 [Promethearchaeota archaeon]|nr:MAG: hypothetical protein EU551_01970 [Candidatus Lokiarchaeota archaeon]